MRTLYHLILLFSVALIFNSCLDQSDIIPPECCDGILNNGETTIDCGGPCLPCNPCENGLWDYQLGETWVDCGGDCGICPPHANGCQDDGESGVDCGGTTGINCTSLCNDGLPNGWETAAINPETQQPWECGEPIPQDFYLDFPNFDCGGDCDPCPTCADNILNQDEQWIDCGGICGDCGGFSTGDCTNGIQDGNEIDIDCGLSPSTVGNCPPCDLVIECYIKGVYHDFSDVVSVEFSTYLDVLIIQRISIHFTGISDDGWVIEGQIAEPSPAGWSLESMIFCNGVSYYNGAENGSYLTISSADLEEGTISSIYTESIVGEGITYGDFTEMYLANPGYIKGEFYGTCMSPNQVSCDITGGNFLLTIPN